jgi:hypothetical protein
MSDMAAGITKMPGIADVTEGRRRDNQHLAKNAAQSLAGRADNGRRSGGGAMACAEIAGATATTLS